MMEVVDVIDSSLPLIGRTNENSEWLSPPQGVAASSLAGTLRR